MTDLAGRNESQNSEQKTVRRVEILIARVLFWGALLSITIAATGLLIYIAKGGLNSGALSLQDQLRQPPGKQAGRTFVSVSEIARSLETLNPLAITAVGLLLLLLVPVIAVALLIPAFLRERDYRYFVIAAIVLFILFLSIFFGGV